MPTGVKSRDRKKAFTIGSDAVGDYEVHPNGQRTYYLTGAITANVTTTTAAAGAQARTSHATGRASLFVSDGAKWQFLTNA